MTKLVKSIRSAQSLICLAAYLSLIPIYFGFLIMWQMSDAPTREERDKSLDSLERKIGETYTSEMHQKFSNIVKDADEPTYQLMDALEKGGRLLVMLGVALFGVSFTSAYLIKKALSTNELAEPQMADRCGKAH